MTRLMLPPSYMERFAKTNFYFMNGGMGGVIVLFNLNSNAFRPNPRHATWTVVLLEQVQPLPVVARWSFNGEIGIKKKDIPDLSLRGL